MSETSSPSLKAANLKWLIVLTVADAVVIIWIASNGTLPEGWPELVERLFIGAIAPAVVLLVVNILPSDLKAMLVFWKPWGVLPGCAAFTRHGPADSRLDMARLEHRVGPLPTDPAEQNKLWFRLYKQVANETTVAEAHRAYLMYRDMAALSLVLALVVPLVLWLGNEPASSVEASLLLFGFQYLVTALSARWSGVRFVCNVLAVQSTTEIPSSR